MDDFSEYGDKKDLAKMLADDDISQNVDDPTYRTLLPSSKIVWPANVDLLVAQAESIGPDMRSFLVGGGPPSQAFLEEFDEGGHVALERDDYAQFADEWMNAHAPELAAFLQAVFEDGSGIFQPAPLDDAVLYDRFEDYGDKEDLARMLVRNTYMMGHEYHILRHPSDIVWPADVDLLVAQAESIGPEMRLSLTDGISPPPQSYLEEFGEELDDDSIRDWMQAHGASELNAFFEEVSDSDVDSHRNFFVGTTREEQSLLSTQNRRVRGALVRSGNYPDGRARFLFQPPTALLLDLLQNYTNPPTATNAPMLSQMYEPVSGWTDETMQGWRDALVDLLPLLESVPDDQLSDRSRQMLERLREHEEAVYRIAIDMEASSAHLPLDLFNAIAAHAGIARPVTAATRRRLRLHRDRLACGRFSADADGCNMQPYCRFDAAAGRCTANWGERVEVVDLDGDNGDDGDDGGNGGGDGGNDGGGANNKRRSARLAAGGVVKKMRFNSAGRNTLAMTAMPVEESAAGAHAAKGGSAKTTPLVFHRNGLYYDSNVLTRRRGW